MAENQEGATGNQQAQDQQFAIQKVYLKDCSVEAPNSPEVFRSEWRPEANVELDTRHREIDSGSYEVAIRITVTAKLGDKTAYLCEVEQAGVFALSGFDQQTLEGLLGSFCPSILFPYAREAVSDLSGKAGFPPMVLAPVNFDALYAQQRRRQQQAGDEGGGEQ
ncbi:MAG: protein-export chaperone SecB [Arhodomonas sp.]|nr:protein-export chaperone SecB [Arhodomonas sp.]